MKTALIIIFTLIVIGGIIAYIQKDKIFPPKTSLQEEIIEIPEQNEIINTETENNKIADEEKTEESKENQIIKKTEEKEEEENLDNLESDLLNNI